MGRHTAGIPGSDSVHGHEQLRILWSNGTKNVRLDAGGRVHRGDEAILEDPSGPAGEHPGDVAARGLELSPSDALEVSGLVAGFQWRPTAPANDALGRSAVAAVARRARAMRAQSVARVGRRIFRGPQSSLKAQPRCCY